MGRRNEANNDPPTQTIQILHLFFFQHTLLICLEILQCCTHSGASWGQAVLGSLGHGPDPPGCQSTVLLESWGLGVGRVLPPAAPTLTSDAKCTYGSSPSLGEVLSKVLPKIQIV